MFTFHFVRCKKKVNKLGKKKNGLLKNVIWEILFKLLT